MAWRDDVVDEAYQRALPRRYARALRIRMAMFHGDPQPYQRRAWSRLIERYPERPDQEWLSSAWVLDEIQEQEEIG